MDVVRVSLSRLIFLDGFADSAPLGVRLTIQQGAQEGQLRSRINLVTSFHFAKLHLACYSSNSFKI